MGGLGGEGVRGSKKFEVKIKPENTSLHDDLHKDSTVQSQVTEKRKSENGGEV